MVGVKRTSNPRPHGPKPCALPNCATPRKIFATKYNIQYSRINVNRFLRNIVDFWRVEIDRMNKTYRLIVKGYKTAAEKEKCRCVDIFSAYDYNDNGKENDAHITQKGYHLNVSQILQQHIAQNGLCYHIETYGCQMNVHDSEKISGVLESLGYAEAEASGDADLILFNTCCVREHAEARLYGNIGALKKHKDTVPGAVIAVCGCMMQQPDAAKKLMRRFPFVDITFGSNDIHHLPGMLHDVLIEGKRALCVDDDETIVEGLPAVRRSAHSAFVNIMYGCNNFCTYCIVPFVRGRERSRQAGDILDEINTLCENGAKEITLLGQNVNSYGKNTEGGLPFPELLERIDTDTDVKRLRFMTSHPKDLTDALISCYGRLDCLCEHIHLPVQSGSDAVLSRMNRRYTRAHYLDLIRRLRGRVPDIAVTTDIIVGFPGETKDEFEQTMSLVDEVQFDAAYTFAYSSRRLTKAAKMSGHLDKPTKADRLARLNTKIKNHMKDKNAVYLGQTVSVLADSVSKRTDDEISGRTRSAKMVTFKGSPDEIGSFVDVKIDRVMVHTLRGVRTGMGN